MNEVLTVIGAGHLGTRVAALWVDRSDEYCVLAETKSSPASGSLQHQRISHRLRADPSPPPSANVLLSIPPSGEKYYRDETLRAVHLWNGEGRLLMISSTAVYAEEDGGICTEDGSLSSSERARRLLNAESVVLDAGGIVLRLAGLYDRDRGVHRHYQKLSLSEQRPDGLVNLIHYDDAARLCMAALQLGERGRVYMGCDNTPQTRATIVEASVRAGVSKAEDACEFTGVDGPIGRICDNSQTRNALKWSPVYPSFVDWLT